MNNFHSEKRKIESIIQFIKFGLVGVSNTIISYGIEMLFFYVILKNAELNDAVRIIITTAVSFLISTANSYFWNNKFVFKDENRHGFKQHFYAYIKMLLSYAITGIGISTAIKLWLNMYEMQYWLITLLTLIVSVPLNFVLNKFWAFKKSK